MKKTILIVVSLLTSILLASEFTVKTNPYFHDAEFECVALCGDVLLIGGDDEHIHRSLDLGKSWSSQKLRGVNGDVDVIFQAKNGVILAGMNEWDAHYIAISTDKGASWARVYKDNSIEIHCMFERNDGTIVGFGDDDVYVSSSTDYRDWDEIKRPWIKESPEYEEIDIPAAKVLPDGNVLIVGEDGFYACYDQAMKKRFYGNTMINGSCDFTTLFLMPDSVLFAGTEDGYLMKSSDRGKTWNLDYSDPLHKEEITGISFNNSGDGVAVGHKGLLFVTQDWGKSWKRIDSKTIENLEDVVTLDENTFFSVGDNGISLSIVVK